jgi:ribosomal protein L16 Arg81 hydroxylase
LISTKDAHESEQSMLTETAASTALEVQSPASQGDLEALFHPVQEQVFFEQYWNRKALYLPGQPDKFAGLFDRAAFDRAVHNCVDLKVGFTDENGWPGHFNIKPEQVTEMLADGKTVCASFIDPQNPVLTAFLNRIARHFAVAGNFFFNSYLSPDGGGFGLHLDHHPVSILQIEGQKRWWYSPEPDLKEVITNVSFPSDRDTLKLPWVTVTRPREKDLCEVVLNPGDVLYMPKGTWHRAQAIGGSLGLTLAMESVVPLDLIQTALLPHLNKVEFRSQVPGYYSRSAQNGMPPELECTFEAALAELRATVNSITPADLYVVWRQVQAARNRK